MRAAALALAYLDDSEALTAAAKAVSDLTHADPSSGEACALWSLGMRNAVLHGTFDGVREGLAYLPHRRAAHWAGLLHEAESRPPSAFAYNGWVVQALQGAWSAIVRAPVPEDDPGVGFVRGAALAPCAGGGGTRRR